MSHPSAGVLAAALTAGLLLAGCTNDPDPVATTGPDTSSSASASTDPSASPSPTSTLTAEEQQAFEEATEVVLAYRQTLVDIYSGATTNLNDLNNVATGDLLDRNLAKSQQDLGEGKRSEPKGVRLVLASAEPVSVDLKGDPRVVVVRACIDGTAVTSVTAEGIRSKGIREQADYTVIRTDYLPDPGWAVARTQVARDSAERSC